MLLELERTNSFSEYMFTNYKSSYTNNEILNILDSNPKIKYLHMFLTDFLKVNINAVNQRGVRVFAHMDKNDFLRIPLQYGCTGIFSDDISENDFVKNHKPYLVSKLKNYPESLTVKNDYNSKITIKNEQNIIK